MAVLKRLGVEKRFAEVFAKYSAMYDIPVEWLYAFARQESSMRPGIITRTGGDGERGGAFGLFQVTLKTARAYGFKGQPTELLDIDTNTYWACQDIKYWRARHGDSILDVYARYNSGKTYSRAPLEHTRVAAKRVMTYVNLYKQDNNNV